MFITTWLRLLPILPYLCYQSCNIPIVAIATNAAVFSNFTTDLLVTKFTVVISVTLLTKSSFNVHWLLQLGNR